METKQEQILTNEVGTGMFPAERTERKAAVSPGSSGGGGRTENSRGRRDLTVKVRDALGVMWMGWQGMAGYGICTRKMNNWKRQHRRHELRCAS